MTEILRTYLKDVPLCKSKITLREKCPKYRVFSGLYFPAFELKTERYGCLSAFSPNAGKYETEITPYLTLLTKCYSELKNGEEWQ